MTPQRKSIFASLLGVVLLFLLLLPSFLRQVPSTDQAHALTTGWRLVDKNGKPKDVYFPVLQRGEDWRGCMLEREIPDLSYSHPTTGPDTISFFSSCSDLSFFLDGAPHTDFRHLPSGYERDYGAGWFLVILPEGAQGKTLQIIPGPLARARETMEIGSSYYGAYADCVRSVAFYSENGATLDALIAMAGLFFLGLSIYTYKTGGNFTLAASIGIFALLAAYSGVSGVTNYVNINTSGPQAGYLPLLLTTPAYILMVLADEGALTAREERRFQMLFGTIWVFALFTLMASATVPHDNFSMYFYIIQHTTAIFLSILASFRAVLRRQDLFDIPHLVSRLFLLTGTSIDAIVYYEGDMLRMGQASRYGIIIYLLIMAIFLYRKAVYQVRKQRIERAQLDAAHMRLMAGQIQPHFIFNTLGAIQSFMRREPERASELMQDFTGYLRYTMRHAEYDELIPFETELDHIRTYVSIERARFGADLRVVYDLDVMDFSVPPLTIQPLVENAVKHGIRGKPGGGTIQLATRETQSGILVSIRDDGVGFNLDEVRRRARADRLGLYNVEYRLAYELEANMEIQSTPGVGTSVLVSIPREEGDFPLPPAESE